MGIRHLPTMTGLQCFEAVARHLSFTRAAHELSLTQSAVSKQVAQLERVVERPLLRRIRRQLQLTPEGALYLTEVRKILAQVDMSSRYLRSYGGQNEVLRVATLPTFGARWLVPRLNGFRGRHPTIYLDICTRLEAFDLNAAGVDVAFFFGHGAWPGADCMRLMDEELVPVCAPALLAEAPVREALELPSLVLLQLASRPEAWHDWFADQGLQTGHSYHGPRFDTFHMIIGAAVVGCGVALVPRFLVVDELAAGRLVIPWHHALRSRDAYYLVYPEHMAEVPKVRALVSWISDRCG